MNELLYGFHALEDVRNELAVENRPAINTAIQQALAEHNRQWTALYGLLASRTTEYQLRFKAANNHRLQALDELGRARPVRRAGEYKIGFPIQKAGVALGETYEERIKMSVQDVNDTLSELETGDITWNIEHALAAYFDNAGWTYEDPMHGAIEVKGLANGDSTLYNVKAGASQGATDNHYLAQANAISDADNPYPEIYEELTEHPENSGQVVAVIASDLRTGTEGLANFTAAPDPNLTQGINETRLTGNLGAAVPGEVIGYVDGVWVSVWQSMPAGYISAVVTQGERPLLFREDEFAQLQGFNAEAEREDYPYLERQYVRRGGYGGWNRIGGLVFQVGAAAYSVPTSPLDYATPLA